MRANHSAPSIRLEGKTPKWCNNSRKGNRNMKYNKTWMLTLIGCSIVGISLSASAQPTPGSVLGLSRDVQGTLAVSSITPSGCPTRFCTTNLITTVRTNCYYKLVCATNALGRLECTNTLVCVTRTNTY